MKVLIIGAGIGGLCLAQFLKKNGVQVEVFERDASPSERKQGYRLHLDADGIEAINESFPTELFQLFELTSTNPLPYTTILNTDFSVHRRFAIDDYSKTNHHVASGRSKHLNVNRATLREIAMVGLEEHIRFGSKLSHYVADTHSVSAYFEDGSMATGDILVGADGTNSAVRKLRAPEAQMMDSGARAIYGRIRLADAQNILPPFCAADVFTAVSDSRKLIFGTGPVIFPAAPSQAAKVLSLNAALSGQQDYIGCIVSGRKEHFGKSDADCRAMDSDALQELAANLLKGWPANAAGAVEKAEKGSFFYIEMASCIPFSLQAHPNVTLLGDAIHTMTPSLGRGANIALRDAVLLGRELLQTLNSGKTIADAIRDYERDMTAYGFEVVRYSAEMGTRLLGQDPLPVANVNASA